MTALFSLAEIRDHAEHMAAHHGGVQIISSREVLALVEVAEAAHRANYNVPCGFCKDDGDCANQRLEDALARFDHACARPSLSEGALTRDFGVLGVGETKP